MDPNVALNNIREAVGELRNQDDDGVLDGTSQVGFLLESFEALDEWLTKGGFLPDAWQADYEHRHEYQGQALVHSHPHHGPHGYFEHPEDGGAPVEPGYDTDVPYSREGG